MSSFRFIIEYQDIFNSVTKKIMWFDNIMCQLNFIRLYITTLYIMLLYFNFYKFTSVVFLFHKRLIVEYHTFSLLNILYVEYCCVLFIANTYNFQTNKQEEETLC